MKKIFFYRIDSAYVVMFLRSLALILVIVLIYLIATNWEEDHFLIAALGILVSALLASFSVVFSIDSNIRLKNSEYSNRVRYIFFYLCRIKMRLISLQNEKKRKEVTFYDIERFFNTVHDINDKLSEINSKELVSIMNNNILTDLHFIILDMDTYNISL